MESDRRSRIIKNKQDPVNLKLGEIAFSLRNVTPKRYLNLVYVYSQEFYQQTLPRKKYEHYFAREFKSIRHKSIH